MMTQSKFVITIDDILPVALEAARKIGIPEENIILLPTPTPPSNPAPAHFARIDDLIKFGLACPTQFEERKLAPGEGKTKVAFLCMSSGTTGKPKVTPDYLALVGLPHLMLV